MNVQDLIDILSECDPNADVRLGVQPSWPLRHEVTGIVTPDDLDTGDEDEVQHEGFVWIVASDGHPYGENPYAPRGLWEHV
jgi:hypothetical protein